MAETAKEKARPLFVIGEDSECWPWLGHINKAGYGCWSSLSHSLDSSTLAHRIVYRMLVGEIPRGLQLDHLCRNRACVNPHHLEVVSNMENARRGADARGVSLRVRIECRSGHPVTPENTYYRPNGGAECRLCRKEIMERFRARHPGYAARKGKEYRAQNRS